MSKLLYVDIGKKSSDLLTKDFPDKTKLEINSRAPNGITFQVTGTRNHDGSIVGAIQPKYISSKHSSTISATIDTSRNLKIEGTSEKYPGVKATVTGVTEPESIKADVEWKADRASLTAGIDAFSTKGTTLSASGVVSHEGFSLGVSGEYIFGDKQEVKKADAVVAYTLPDLQFTLFGRQKGYLYGASYFQKLSPDLSLAAELAIDSKKTDVAPKLTVGVSNNFDQNGTQAKLKFDTEGKLSLSYSQKISQWVKFTLGTSVNVNNLGASGNHQVGVGLVFDF